MPVNTSLNPILVTCYVDPDLDGVAGATAYAEFLRKTGTDAIAGIMGTPHIEAQYLLDRFQIPQPRSIQNDDAFDQVILVDSSDLKGFEGNVLPEKVIEIIDHRALHESEKFPNAKTQIELVGSAATLVAERFMQQNVDISKESAILVYGAILSGTLNFRNSITTDRDRNAAAWVNRVANLPLDFWREQFRAKSDLSGSRLYEVMEHDFSQFVMGGKAVGIAQLEMLGGRRLIEERKEELLQILERLKREKALDLIFLTIIELEDCKNILVAPDPDVRQLLEKALDVQFHGVTAERAKVLMRKQITPLLKEKLDV